MSSRARTAIGLAAVLVLGVGLRLFVAWHAFSTTSDTATVGLMAIDILDGARPLFYYGQRYMGALEAYLAAGCFRVFGVSSFVLSFASILLTAFWILGNYALFRRLTGSTGGLVAGLCTAVCGWYAFWYSLATYGGYSAFLAIGTWWLYGALVLFDSELRPRSEWRLVVLLGVLAALGVWVNLQVMAYFAAGTMFLLARAFRERFRIALICRLGLIPLIAALGVLPYVMAEKIVPAPPSMGGLSLDLLPGNARILVKECLPGLFRWPVWEDSLVMQIFMWLAILSFVGAGLVACGVAIAGRRWMRNPTLLVVPLFVVAFLGMYLPHSMARLGAERYLISVHTFVVCAAFAFAIGVSRRAVRRMAWAALVVWVSFNAVCAVGLAHDRKDKHLDMRQEWADVAEAVRSLGVRYVWMVGSETTGYQAAIPSFHAKGDPRFLSLYRERDVAAARAADVGEQPGFMCSVAHRERVCKALQTSGVRSFSTHNTRGRVLVHSIELSHRPLRAVPRGEIVPVGVYPAAGISYCVLDRRHGTTQSGRFDEAWSWTFDLQESRRVAGIRMLASQAERLPDSYRVSVSEDGEAFREVCDATGKVPNAYVAGDKLYMMGFEQRRETMWPTTRARYLRIECEPVSRSGRWTLDELYVLELHDGGRAIPQPRQDAVDIAAMIAAGDVRRVICDRWLGSMLREQLSDADVACEVVNVEHVLDLSRTSLLVVDASLADGTATLLTGDEPFALGVAPVVQSSSYAVFDLTSGFNQRPDYNLLWTGSALLRQYEEK